MYISVHRPEDLSQLQSHVVTEKNAKQRDRYRAVLLGLQGQMCSQIMDKLGRSKDFVQRWVYAYRDGGIPAIQPKKQPGARPKLSVQQEQEIKARLDAGPRPEDQVCTLRGKDVVRIIEESFEVRYTLRGAYNLLERLGYSCLRPRPRHRKNHPQAMDQFKQDAPLLPSK